mmetsp:Transcript_27314/g.70884  ORF Transcript_27314/g.70884 Transcript_27314/m.70884 type:complete len:298 (-) Transcript_27314:1676-2569(-)
MAGASHLVATSMLRFSASSGALSSYTYGTPLAVYRTSCCLAPSLAEVGSAMVDSAVALSDFGIGLGGGLAGGPSVLLADQLPSFSSLCVRFSFRTGLSVFCSGVGTAACSVSGCGVCCCCCNCFRRRTALLRTVSRGTGCPRAFRISRGDGDGEFPVYGRMRSSLGLAGSGVEVDSGLGVSCMLLVSTGLSTGSSAGDVSGLTCTLVETEDGALVVAVASSVSAPVFTPAGASSASTTYSLSSFVVRRRPPVAFFGTADVAAFRAGAGGVFFSGVRRAAAGRAAFFAAGFELLLPAL